MLCHFSMYDENVNRQRAQEEVSTVVFSMMQPDRGKTTACHSAYLLDSVSIKVMFSGALLLNVDCSTMGDTH